MVDNVLHATEGGLHFSLHVPDAYDGSKPYALYVALPGWEGLWFQGVGAHLQEDFPFVANDNVADMIVASPQLEDWGETSARQTIALTQWLLSTYNVAADRMVLSGCSGGGETASLVMGTRPELFAAVLHCISQWDGDIEPLIAARVPVYMATGENDDYYGPSSVRETYGAKRIHGSGARRGGGLPTRHVGREACIILWRDGAEERSAHDRRGPLPAR